MFSTCTHDASSANWAPHSPIHPPTVHSRTHALMSTGFVTLSQAVQMEAIPLDSVRSALLSLAARAVAKVVFLLLDFCSCFVSLSSLLFLCTLHTRFLVFVALPVLPHCSFIFCANCHLPNPAVTFCRTRHSQIHKSRHRHTLTTMSGLPSAES